MKSVSVKVLTGCTFLIVLLHQDVSSSTPGTLYSCVDWECEEWISKGKTLLRYIAKTDKHLSFQRNEDILIISKPVDGTISDWVGKIGDKVGLVPKDMIREDKMSKSPQKFKVELSDIPAFTKNNEVEEDQEDDEEQEEPETGEDIKIEDIGESDNQTVNNLDLDLEAAANTSESDPTAPSEANKNEAIDQSNTTHLLDDTTETPANRDQSSETENLVETLIAASATSTTPEAETVRSEMALEQSTVVGEDEKEISNATDGQESSLDPVENVINLQPSSDTVLQGTSTVEYLPETPKTEGQKPSDEITPRIPASAELFLNSMTTSILSAAEDGRANVETVSPTQTQSQVEEVPVEKVTSLESESTEETSQDQDATTIDASLTQPVQMKSEVSPETPVTVIENTEATVTSDDSGIEQPVESLNAEEVVESDSQEHVSVSSEEPSESESEAENIGKSEHDESKPMPDETQESANQDHDVINEQEETPTTAAPPEEIQDFEDDAKLPLAEDPEQVPDPKPETTSPESNGAPVPNDSDELKEKSNIEEEKGEVEVSSGPGIGNVDDSIPGSGEEQTNSEEESIDSNEVAQSEETEDENITVSPQEDLHKEDAISTPSPLEVDTLPPSVERVEDKEPDVVEQEATATTPPIITHDEDIPPLTTEGQDAHGNGHPDLSAYQEEEEETQDDHQHEHDHHHHHHHHHKHNHLKDVNDSESSSITLVIKHLSSTLLSFLPEPLQDTILDVDDALVFTGIIALTLVSICVPYFFIEGYMSVRPLKKKVVELNKSLWKVSAAYETQQEEFEIFKQKAMAFDEFKKRADQSENDVLILKKLETKHREQITQLRSQLKAQIKEAGDIRALIEKTLQDKKVVVEECEKYKAAYESTKDALTSVRDELNNIQTQTKSSALLLNVSSKNAEVLTAKLQMAEGRVEEMQSQLIEENEKRRAVESEKSELELGKAGVEKELADFKQICHQYEDTVSSLNDEIGRLESELAVIKETLGEDSPLIEIAEIQAKATFSEKEATSLRTRLEGLKGDNENLNRKVKEVVAELEETREDKQQTNKRLQVLETYFKEREEDFIKTIEQLQLKESVRDKGKDELIRVIEEKENVCKDLNERLEALKEEFEETKQQHRNEIRGLEAKSHENWLSLCQAERKAQDARKEAKLLRERLTALTKEKDDEDGDGLNGDVPLFPVLPDELVPLPIMDDSPSYFGLGDFEPPPPLPEGDEREPHRPPPLGGRLSPSFSDMDDISVLSPIGVGRREDECTDGSSGPESPTRRSPPLRGGWVDRQGQGTESFRRLTRATSSPIQPGANL